MIDTPFQKFVGNKRVQLKPRIQKIIESCITWCETVANSDARVFIQKTSEQYIEFSFILIVTREIQLCPCFQTNF